jgi:4-methylaminobutanoate oxidase (formaldehyde-forming)
VYEEDPLFVDADGIPGAVAEMPLDDAVLWRAADDVARELPVLRRAGVREHRGGMPTMTADGRQVVGPAPDVAGREDDLRRDAAWHYRHFCGAA